MVLLLAILLFNPSQACPDPKLIVCHTICTQEGDEIGIIVNDKCICGNSRDISKVPLKLPRTFVSKTPVEPKSRYEDY